MGRGRYELLKSINKTHSLKKSAEKVGIAEKTAYNYIKKIERRLKKKITETKKGGKKAGATITLTKTGQELIRRFENLKK